ncbi:hypothetical protein BFAG_03299 [Bacteroides fragilis 3_1_12]|uniref:Uncharacterized protein n=1 Tax=Bacteroides fragilis 3_1_12 TaxID=457424 RepID=A0ABN0BNR3_BACFG|nr:hypothetical protein BFAG_03299 [Bacteroides fragilis 3_1_12]
MVRTQFHGAALPSGCRQAFREPDGHGPFYTYYQISRDDESDEAETEPKKGRELKSRYEGSHSPFGFVWQIADATGWSVDYILNGVNYQTLIMMLSDAPRYVRKETEKSAEDEAREIAGFFQSKLK